MNAISRFHSVVTNDSRLSYCVFTALIIFKLFSNFGISLDHNGIHMEEFEVFNLSLVEIEMTVTLSLTKPRERAE